MSKKKVFLGAAALLLIVLLAVCCVPKLRTQTFVALYHGEIERMITEDGSVPADDATLCG